MNALKLGIAISLATMLAPVSYAQDAGILDKKTAEKVHAGKAYSPYVNRNFPTRPFFGDTHLHTGFSMDAGAFGAKLTPRDAYRFARGEQVMASSNQPAKLGRPLDFLVVADHSDNMGFFPDLFAGKPNVLASPTGKKWYEMIKNGQGPAAALDIIGQFSQGTFPKELFYAPGTSAYKSAWRIPLQPQRNIMSQAVLLPLLVMNGPPSTKVTTSTVT